MRAESWERMGLDPRKAVLVSLAVAAAFFSGVLLVGEELGMGTVAVVLALLSSAVAGYLVATAPRRTMRLAAFRQTLEAPSLAASSNIYVRSTSSRSKTFLMLRAEEGHLGRYLAEVRRRVLLGYDVPSAARAAVPQDHIFSESVKTVMESVVGVDGSRAEDGGDEMDGLLSSSGLEEETKLPLFIAVSFFLPIMLMLFAAMSKETGAAALGALVVLEVIVLDLALTVSGSSVAWGAREA